jgi:hypothetical protein
VQICASSYNKGTSNQSICHFSEMIPRSAFEAMTANLNLKHSHDVNMSMAEAMSQK